MLAPVEALSHIKCNACNKYLSYFPIYINPESLAAVCGRCSELLTTIGNYIQDKTYESFVQFVKFPCIYDSEGCVEHLSPSDVPQHEKICSYRVISCALDCVWQGTVMELSDHVQEIHPGALVRNGEFEIDVLNAHEAQSFLFHEDEVFLLKQKFNQVDNIVQCSLSYYKSFGSVADYYYELTIYNGSRNLCVKFPMKPADNYQDNITEINVDNVKKSLDDPSIIIGYIKVFNMEDKNGSDEPRKPDPAINMDMLGELECPVCFDYIIPPIYQCVTGHSICGDCKSKVAQCPTCTGDIKNTQNFTLEKMAFLLTYPCKYVEFGCDFASKPGQMKQHQKHCLHGPHLCPLKDYETCNWKGTAKDLYAHITAKHHDSILDIDNLYVFFNNGYFEAEDDQCFIKKFMNVMFKIHYRYARDCFYWAVQPVGPQEEVRKYKFEIDVHDNSNNNQKMFVRSLCTGLKDREETFSEPGQYVFLKREQIDSFLTDQLSYTIRITKY